MKIIFLFFLIFNISLSIQAQSLNREAQMMRTKFPELYRCVSSKASNNTEINAQAKSFDIITDAINEYKGDNNVQSLISLAVVQAGGKKGKMCETDWVRALKYCKEYMPSKF